MSRQPTENEELMQAIRFLRTAAGDPDPGAALAEAPASAAETIRADLERQVSELQSECARLEAELRTARTAAREAAAALQTTAVKAREAGAERDQALQDRARLLALIEDSQRTIAALRTPPKPPPGFWARLFGRG